MNIFRIHIRPKGGTAHKEESFSYCLGQGFLGVGWRRNDRESCTKDWDEYVADASFTNLNVVAYIKNNVNPGDLVWTRDPNANYYLARVVSGWEYFSFPEAQEKDIDIANIFRCNLCEVKTEAVPGKVVASFRGTRTIQRVYGVLEYSKYLWNDLSKEDFYDVDKTEFHDLFDALDAEETEDLVFIYLQYAQEWIVVPNTRKGDTMKYEFRLVKPSGERASVQVKTGNSPINLNEYLRNDEMTIYLFQPNEKYTGSVSNHVVCLRKDQLLDFVKAERDWLPDSIRKKMELVEM